jgi:protein-disulfide isomerase
MKQLRLCLAACALALVLPARAQSAPAADAQVEGRKRIEAALQQRAPEAALRTQLVALGIAEPTLGDALAYYRKELERRQTLDAVKPSILPGNAPVKGGAAAPVTIIEVSDFECPFCARVQPTLLQLEKDYAGKLRIAFKFFPLPSHTHARPAAAAAQAARRQGKFWEMHDYLFAHQTELEKLEAAGFAAAAADLGLSATRFSADYQALLKDQSAVEADITETKRWLVDATPAFFINGESLLGAKPIAEFKRLIDAALAAKPAPAAKKKPGTKPKA